MLQRIIHKNGVETYQSPLLAAAGVVHAFSTRIGGVSLAPFMSLNLGNPSTPDTPQDSPENLRENYARLQEALGVPAALRCWLTQVHSGRVEIIEPEGETEYAETLAAEVRDRWSGQTQADALLTAQPNLLLTIRVADCLPVLFASVDGSFVAAAHAGWRGIVAGILPRTVRAFGECGVPPDQIVAAIGPGLGLPHFEVGPEVAEQFVRVGLDSAVNGSFGPKPHIDLQAAALLQLQRAGLPRLDTHPFCTFRDIMDFYSHRRDHGVTGRMAGVILRRPGA